MFSLRGCHWFVRLMWALGVQFTQVFDGQHADVSVLCLEHALIAVNADDRAHGLSLVSQNHLGLWASSSDQTLHSSHITIIMGNSYKALFSNSVCCPKQLGKNHIYIQFYELLHPCPIYMLTYIIGRNCHKYHFCHDKTHLLSQQKYAFREKHLLRQT